MAKNISGTLIIFRYLLGERTSYRDILGEERSLGREKGSYGIDRMELLYAQVSSETKEQEKYCDIEKKRSEKEEYLNRQDTDKKYYEERILTKDIGQKNP